MDIDNNISNNNFVNNVWRFQEIQTSIIFHTLFSHVFHFWCTIQWTRTIHPLPQHWDGIEVNIVLFSLCLPFVLLCFRCPPRQIPSDYITKQPQYVELGFSDGWSSILLFFLYHQFILAWILALHSCWRIFFCRNTA